MTITDTNSYTTVIRDVLFAKLCTLNFFQGFTARRVRQLPTQEYHLPYLGVYIVSESMVPDGDWNATVIKFQHDITIGFSVQFANSDPLALELKLDEAFWTIMHGLWRDQYICNMIDTWNPTIGAGSPGNTRFEGIIRGSRRHNWGTTGAKNETPFGELQYEPVIRYRTYWEPIIPDDLETIRIETVPVLDLRRGIPSADEVQRVISYYELK